MTLPTSQIREIRDAASKAAKMPHFINGQASYEWDSYERKADPTTIMQVCDELLERRTAMYNVSESNGPIRKADRP